MSKISSTLTRPQSLVSESPSMSDASTASPKTMTIKCCYQADQQVKFLHLQAEIDSLLQELQTIKDQRLASADEAILLEEHTCDSYS